MAQKCLNFQVFARNHPVCGRTVVEFGRTSRPRSHSWSKRAEQWCTLYATAQMVVRPHSRLSWPKIVISSFACPIQLIPVPMVLVKIINGKFGIIEMFGNPQGVFWSFDDHFCNKFCRIQRREVSRRRISRSSKRSQDFYKLRWVHVEEYMIVIWYVSYYELCEN